MRKIKVVQILAEKGLGGGTSHVLGILDHLDKNRFECFLICPTGAVSKKAETLSGVKVYTLPLKSKFDFNSASLLHNLLKKIQSGEGDPFAPVLAHIHGARAIWLGRMLPVKNIKYLYTEHRFDSDYRLANPLNLFSQKKFLGFLIKKMDLVIAVSESVKDFLIKEKMADPAKTIEIPNGISLPPQSNRKIRENVKAPIIGAVGNLNRQKGQIYLIHAMPEILRYFPAATLEIIGEGDELHRLIYAIESNNLKRHVSLLGRKENTREFMKHWDVFAMPSIAETFGIAALEAMAQGIPVVSSRVGGLKEIIENNKSGILVPAKDPKALARAVVRVLRHPVLAAELKRGGIRRAANFDWQKVIKQIEAGYERLASAQQSNYQEG